MALAWNAGWVNALRGSNPLSSAKGKPLRTAEKRFAGVLFLPGFRHVACSGTSHERTTAERWVLFDWYTVGSWWHIGFGCRLRLIEHVHRIERVHCPGDARVVKEWSA